MMTQVINDVEPNLENVKFFEVNVDEADNELVSKYDIRSIPVILFFKDGTQVDNIVGSRTKTQFVDIINKNR